MDSRSPDTIAEEWLLKWSTGKAAKNIDSALHFELPRKQPNLSLAAILKVLERIDTTSPNEVLGALAAGPLEDLLSHNGYHVVEQVDELARRDPGFRLLLNGVWDSSIVPCVLSRLAKYRGNRW
jgi:hypothetical protein